MKILQVNGKGVKCVYGVYVNFHGSEIQAYDLWHTVPRFYRLSYLHFDFIDGSTEGVKKNDTANSLFKKKRKCGSLSSIEEMWNLKLCELCSRTKN